MKKICNNKKCSKSEIVIEASFEETSCENCGSELNETDKPYRPSLYSEVEGRQIANQAWKNISWMDKGKYENFEFFYKSRDWEGYASAEDSARTTLNFIGVLAIAILAWLFIYFWKVPSNISTYFDEKSEQKARCQTSDDVRSSKTDFAAKQAFEKCMNK